MVEAILDTVKPLLQKNGNTLTVSFGEHVGTMRADLMKTRQILLNLLSNAGKFTEGGSILLEVEGQTAGEHAWVVFKVIDSGVGMTADQRQKIFDPFTQADVTTTRKYGGTGLGLAIVARFCALMGGEIAVESQPGEGSRFTVRIPRQVTELVADPVVAGV